MATHVKNERKERIIVVTSLRYYARYGTVRDEQCALYMARTGTVHNRTTRNGLSQLSCNVRELRSMYLILVLTTYNSLMWEE